MGEFGLHGLVVGGTEELEKGEEPNGSHLEDIQLPDGLIAVRLRDDLLAPRAYEGDIVIIAIGDIPDISNILVIIPLAKARLRTQEAP